MYLTPIKSIITSFNKNRRKIIAVVVSLTILFSLFFGGLAHHSLTCCTILHADKDMEHHFENTDSRQSDEISKCLNRPKSHINCVKVSMGDAAELLKAKRHIKFNKTDDLCQPLNFAENCKALNLVYNHITHGQTILKDEEEFPLAFSIKMHKNPKQAERLLRTIYRPHNVYCIYVDKKAENETFDVMKKISLCFDNIFIIENRINIVYSSINLIEAELQCMRILNQSKTTWKYYINLTGQEFPLKTNNEIVKILQKLQGANDIESYDYPFTMQRRYTRRHDIRGNAIYKTKEMKSSFMKRFQMSKGSAYGAFSRDFVEFILTDTIATRFLRWLNGTYAPEESAWATLNSLPWAPGGYPIRISQSASSFISRAVIWSWKSVKCHGHYVRGICIFGSGDLPWLVNKNELIANKFDIDHDHIVLDCLEEILQDRTRTNSLQNLNWDFYNNLPHVKYYSTLHSSQLSPQYRNRKKDLWLKDHNITTHSHLIKR